MTNSTSKSTKKSAQPIPKYYAEEGLSHPYYIQNYAVEDYFILNKIYLKALIDDTEMNRNLISEPLKLIGKMVLEISKIRSDKTLKTVQKSAAKVAALDKIIQKMGYPNIALEDKKQVVKLCENTDLYPPEVYKTVASILTILTKKPYISGSAFYEKSANGFSYICEAEAAPKITELSKFYQDTVTDYFITTSAYDSDTNPLSVPHVTRPTSLVDKSEIRKWIAHEIHKHPCLIKIKYAEGHQNKTKTKHSEPDSSDENIDTQLDETQSSQECASASKNIDDIE